MNTLPVLKNPAACTESELAAFETTLYAAGEPASPTLGERIRRAECLAFLPDAIGALKCPSADHCRGVFKRAGAEASPENFALELGWLTGSAAGLPAIIEALVRAADGRPVFIITRADDDALHEVLAGHGFHAEGAPSASPRGAYRNQLFVCAN